MDVIEIIALGGGLHAFGLLLTVINFDAEVRVDLGLENAGLLLPLVFTVTFHHLCTTAALPNFVRHITPTARVALALPVVLACGVVVVAELFEDRQFG